MIVNKVLKVQEIKVNKTYILKLIYKKFKKNNNKKLEMLI